MSRIKYIKYIFHWNELYIPYNQIKNELIKQYLAEFKYFIYKTISNELNFIDNKYTISIGLGDFPNFCWEPVCKEFIVVVTNQDTSKEHHFMELSSSLIYYFYPDYYKDSILKYPFVADIFTASTCLKLLSMYGMISYYDSIYTQNISVLNNINPHIIYNKHGRKASRFGRWNYSNHNLLYLADLSYKIGTIIQERLPLKDILMMGKFNTIEDWINYLQIDDRLFVRLLLSQEHIKY